MAREENEEAVPRKQSEERRPLVSEPLPRGKLPEDLQKIIDREDDFLDALYDGQCVQPIPFHSSTNVAKNTRLHWHQLSICCLRQSSSNNSPERPALCRLYLWYWRVFQTSCSSLACERCLWYLMGIPHWGCEPWGIQSLLSKSEVAVSKPWRCKERHGHELDADARFGFDHDKEFKYSRDRGLSSRDGPKSSFSKHCQHGVTGLYNT